MSDSVRKALETLERELLRAEPNYDSRIASVEERLGRIEATLNQLLEWLHSTQDAAGSTLAQPGQKPPASYIAPTVDRSEALAGNAAGPKLRLFANGKWRTAIVIALLAGGYAWVRKYQ